MVSHRLEQTSSLQLNIDKSKCYISPCYTPDNFDQLSDIMTEDQITLPVVGSFATGMKFYEISIAGEEPSHVPGFLPQIAKKIYEDLSLNH